MGLAEWIPYYRDCGKRNIGKQDELIPGAGKYEGKKLNLLCFPWLKC